MHEVVPSPRVLGAALLLAALTAAPRLADAQTFTYAGVSWDQAHTPDVITALSPGTYSAAVITAVPSAATSSISGFPDPPATGFDATLTDGAALFSLSGARAVNLPAGDNGTTARSGFEVSWSGALRLVNGAGDDFVVFESASSSTGAEGFMVQVYNYSTSTWSGWWYEPSEDYAPYSGSGTGAGAMATSYELSDLGVGMGQEVSAIRVANLRSSDRMVSGGTGFVLPEDNGVMSSDLPDPGPLGTGASFASSSLDPDPVYVAAFSAPVPVELELFRVD